ncbi:PREDICTED: epididymal-specific lipocalin-5-like [Galeopterus variegatus]|uniref:Epididymal-specific lipocalin-5-like n=1 Tax=Galeopterus variegatus TaxID=482537 RepID=A0ABM0SHQ8_GALVR|nr:PREDICTED: epididymal-specific lipocalin-5-like [Galeopterus variegatus]
MEGKVLVALMGMCVGLVASSQDAALKDFDMVKLSGLWYEIAVASKLGLYSSAHRTEKMRAVLVELEGSHLALTTAYYDEDRCVKEKDGALQGDTPGKFKVLKTAGNKEVLVVATDYQTHTIMDISFHKDGEAHRVLKLYSRSLDHNEEALKKFKDMARERGFTKADVHLLQHDREWPPPRVRASRRWRQGRPGPARPPPRVSPLCFHPQ